MIEDREGKGVEAMASVTDRFLDEARKRPELAGVFTTFSARVPQLQFDIDRTKARRLDVAVSDVFSVLQANLGAYYVNDFNLYGKIWKVMVQAEANGAAPSPRTSPGLYVLNHKGGKVPLSALGEVKYTLGPIDVPHYNMYTAAKITGQPAAGLQLGPGDRGDAGRSRPRSCPRASGTSGPARPTRSRRPATWRPTSSPCRSSASSCSWRPCTRAGSGRW